MMLLSASIVASAQEVPTSFPRKYLLEHFTGDGCGNCPGGMAAMVGYTQSVSTPCIWVSHHYGYNEDEYTISESAKIAKAIAVSGAPNLGINRTKITGTAIAFHPGYLVEDGMADLIAKKCEATAEASVVINHTYDTLTRELNVTVSGQVANAEVTEYLLTVLIKENGLVGKQEDGQYYSFMSKIIISKIHLCVNPYNALILDSRHVSMHWNIFRFFRFLRRRRWFYLILVLRLYFQT